MESGENGYNILNDFGGPSVFVIRRALALLVLTVALLGAPPTRSQVPDEELAFAVAADGDEELMAEILSKGVSASLADSAGWTLLAHAAAANNAEVAGLLIRRGSSVHTAELDKSPLVIAAAAGSQSVVEILIRTPGIPAAHINEAYSIAAMRGDDTLITSMNTAIGETHWALWRFHPLLRSRFGAEHTQIDSAFMLQFLNACRARGLYARAVCVTEWHRQSPF